MDVQVIVQWELKRTNGEYKIVYKLFLIDRGSAL